MADDKNKDAKKVSPIRIPDFNKRAFEDPKKVEDAKFLAKIKQKNHKCTHR